MNMCNERTPFRRIDYSVSMMHGLCHTSQASYSIMILYCYRLEIDMGRCTYVQNACFMFKNELSALCLGLHSGKARLRGGSPAFFPRCHRLFRGMLEGSSTSPQKMDISYNNLVLYGVLDVVS